MKTSDITDEQILSNIKGAESVMDLMIKLGLSAGNRRSFTKRLISLGVLEDVKKNTYNPKAYTREQLIEALEKTTNVSEILRILGIGRGYTRRINNEIKSLGFKPNSRNKLLYTDNDIIVESAKVKSLYSLLKALGLKRAGGSCETIKRHLKRLNVDTTHWTGKLWNKGQRLKDWSDYTSIVSIKKHIMNERGKICELCKNAYWMGQTIMLELDHIDGDSTNNNPKNLRLLCLNCHSQTGNYRNVKRIY